MMDLYCIVLSRNKFLFLYFDGFAYCVVCSQEIEKQTLGSRRHRFLAAIRQIVNGILRSDLAVDYDQLEIATNAHEIIIKKNNVNTEKRTRGNTRN